MSDGGRRLSGVMRINLGILFCLALPVLLVIAWSGYNWAVEQVGGEVEVSFPNTKAELGTAVSDLPPGADLVLMGDYSVSGSGGSTQVLPVVGEQVGQPLPFLDGRVEYVTEDNRYLVTEAGGSTTIIRLEDLVVVAEIGSDRVLFISPDRVMATGERAHYKTRRRCHRGPGHAVNGAG